MKCRHGDLYAHGSFGKNFQDSPWMAVHEAMRSALYSPKYGNRLLDARRNVKPKAEEYPGLVEARFSYRRCARSIAFRDRWYRRVCISFSERPDILPFIPMNSFCPHQLESFLGNHFSEQLQAALTHLCIHSDRSREAGFTYRIYRCHSCPTEVLIEVQPISLIRGRILLDYDNDEAGFNYVLSHSRYVDFGNCRAPDEIEWKSLTTWGSIPKAFNTRLPGWPGYEAPPGIDSRPTIDVTGMEMISARFRRQKGDVVLPAMEHAEEPIAPPPPYDGGGLAVNTFGNVSNTRDHNDNAAWRS